MLPSFTTRFIRRLVEIVTLPKIQKKYMITSPDNLKVGTYFAIITSNPINLKPLGFGTDKMRRDAWMKIREEDNKMNPARSDSQDMYEEHDFLVFRLYN